MKQQQIQINRFKKGDLIMAYNKYFAFFPVFKIVDNKPLIYVVQNYKVDNDYDREGDEFILPKYWANHYLKVKLEN